MRRRTLLEALASSVIIPMARVRLAAQVRAFTPEAVAVLRDVAATVLPASLGADKVSLIVDRSLAWGRDYEGQCTVPAPNSGFVAVLEALRAAVAGCDALVHAAAAVSLDPRDAARLLRDNVAGARCVIDAACAAGLAGIVYVSSLSTIWGIGGPDPGPESPVRAATNAYAVSRPRQKIAQIRRQLTAYCEPCR